MTLQIQHVLMDTWSFSDNIHVGGCDRTFDIFGGGTKKRRRKLRQITFGFYDSSNAGTLCKSMETDGNMDCSIQGRQYENWNGDNDYE